MKTKSAWGNPPKRLYNILNRLTVEKGENFNVCIVGCSDGKFVMPFARKKIQVVGYDIDDMALYGGKKLFPLKRENIDIKEYVSSDTKHFFPELPCEEREISGLLKRLELESLTKYVTIKKEDYYRTEVKDKFELVFTSCSIQYKSNRDLGIIVMMNKLKASVKEGGYLYMDYMMPLEDRHTWKSELFLRTGQIREFFDDDWEIAYCREQKKPILELAHVDRPADHYHRFGYILARRKNNG